jgi:hypothetical protein
MARDFGLSRWALWLSIGFATILSSRNAGRRSTGSFTRGPWHQGMPRIGPKDLWRASGIANLSRRRIGVPLGWRQLGSGFV